MKPPPRYVPGVWKGEPDGMRPLTEADWVDLMHKSRTELDAEERSRVERTRVEPSRVEPTRVAQQTPTTTEPL